MNIVTLTHSSALRASREERDLLGLAHATDRRQWIAYRLFLRQDSVCDDHRTERGFRGGSKDRTDQRLDDRNWRGAAHRLGCRDLDLRRPRDGDGFGRRRDVCLLGL